MGQQCIGILIGDEAIRNIDNTIQTVDTRKNCGRNSLVGAAGGQHRLAAAGVNPTSIFSKKPLGSRDRNHERPLLVGANAGSCWERHWVSRVTDTRP